MRFTLLLPVFILCFYSCTNPEFPESPPNIIFILADDLGYGDLGCYGQSKIETPNIDALAAAGMRFTQHYSGSPVCAPARCVFLTGQHTGNAFVRGNHEWGERGDVWDFAKAVEDPNLEGQYPMPTDTITVAELLQSKGYATGMVGKWGLGGPLSDGVPNNQGFDFFYGYNCQRQAHTYYPKHLWKNKEKVWLKNEVLAPGTPLDNLGDSLVRTAYDKYTQVDFAPTLMHQEALGFIERNKEQPFFLYYASPIPHLPLQAPARWVEYYEKKFGPEKPYPGGKGYFPTYAPRATYAAMVSYLDEQVGELVAKLKAEGIYENTLIVFTSDNGPTYDVGGADSEFFDSAMPFRSERGWGKGFVQEGGIRVPMVAVWPNRISAGTTSETISAFWDWLPTFSAIAAVDTSVYTDGINILPSLLDEAQTEQHDYLYWEFPSYGGQQAVRKNQWKAIRMDILKEGNTSIQLFDLNEDPTCQRNIAEQHPEVVQEMAAIMEEAHEPAAIERFRLPAIEPVAVSD